MAGQIPLPALIISPSSPLSSSFQPEVNDKDAGNALVDSATAVGVDSTSSLNCESINCLFGLSPQAAVSATIRKHISRLQRGTLWHAKPVHHLFGVSTHPPPSALFDQSEAILPQIKGLALQISRSPNRRPECFLCICPIEAVKDSVMHEGCGSTFHKRCLGNHIAISLETRTSTCPRCNKCLLSNDIAGAANHKVRDLVRMQLNNSKKYHKRLQDRVQTYWNEIFAEFFQVITSGILEDSPFGQLVTAVHDIRDKIIAVLSENCEETYKLFRARSQYVFLSCLAACQHGSPLSKIRGDWMKFCQSLDEITWPSIHVTEGDMRPGLKILWDSSLKNTLVALPTASPDSVPSYVHLAAANLNSLGSNICSRLRRNWKSRSQTSELRWSELKVKVDQTPGFLVCE